MSRPIGFTLVEVILVLTILLAIAALGVPVLRGTLAMQQLKSSADQIRGEWTETQVQAMEDGQIFCIRYKLGSSTMVIDRVLDTHFTAGLSSRQTTRRFDTYNELDPFEKGRFTGDVQDFILREPDLVTADGTATIVELPSSVIFADVIVIAEERAAFYLGLTVPGEVEVDENAAGTEAVMLNEMRLGETASADGTIWSAPVFFYPDGTTSTAAVLIRNELGRYTEVRLRGLTGTGTLTDITMQSDYIGELDTGRF